MKLRDSHEHHSTNDSLQTKDIAFLFIVIYKIITFIYLLWDLFVTNYDGGLVQILFSAKIVLKGRTSEK